MLTGTQHSQSVDVIRVGFGKGLWLVSLLLRSGQSFRSLTGRPTGAFPCGMMFGHWSADG